MNVTKETLLDALSQRGFRHQDKLLHVFAGGSNAHGAQIPSKNDLDVCGVFIETPLMALGLDREEHFVTKTAEEGRKNTAEDVDYQLYTLRKWATLAVKGNPNVMGYLFMPAAVESVWTTYILPNRNLFLASSHTTAFLGMGSNTLKRLQGVKGTGRHGQREDVHGYDTKAAMHMILTMEQCLELLNDGKMTFPNPKVELLLDIRLGKFSQRDVEHLYIDLEAQVKEAERKSHLPRHVDRPVVSKLITEAYLEHWNSRGELPEAEPIYRDWNGR